MRTVSWFAVVVFLAAAPGAVRSEGLVYQLPDDGVWVRFDADGTGTEPDGTKVTMAGTITMSCVGTEVVDGQRCRWIEIASEVKRDDQPFTTLEKLLIPEEYLAKGQDPTKHVLKGWEKHSMVAGGVPREIKDLEGQGARYLVARLRPMLHGPFEAPKKLDKVTLDSKLGRLECEGISAQEKTDQAGTSLDSTYTIRLHEKAPFGVVAWEGETKVSKDGQSLGTMSLKLKLSDFGKDAKSSIPDAK